MVAEISNTSYGYVVCVFLCDANGYGQWHGVKNFGDRQGDAIAFKQFDLPKFSYDMINHLVKSFKMSDKFMRLGFRHYVKS